MIIDAKKYGGKCTCGRDHALSTELCVVEAGCLERIDEYLRQYGLTGYCTAVYDRNTYNAEGLVRPHADFEVILDPTDLHANEHGVELLWEQMPAETEFLIAVGSGTIHDITRYCAYKKGISFVSCPTAASVDGFCSSVAAMTWEGAKKTLTAVSPKIVLADLNVISKAPLFLAKSGFGDIIGKYIALADWRIANTLTGEYFCDRIHDMMMEATDAVKESSLGIANGDVSAYEKLTYGLLMSGLAMQMLGNSRPASGAEHHISHLIEMAPEGIGVSSDALHGEKVGVATILACAEYHRLGSVANADWNDYPAITSEYLRNTFGERLYQQLIAENEKDSAAGITGDLINRNWKKICEILETIPETDELLELYAKIGVKTTLADIGVDEGKADLLLEASPCVRNRLTLMRLRRGLLLI
ncbi:MAG: sn-glycerol-1-phosphate dehydrogenase [Clostridia bacterium]|nr:sn-glycerol-1-phosphate dehydrogenase [Clostridia bacterium]